MVHIYFAVPHLKNNSLIFVFKESTAYFCSPHLEFFTPHYYRYFLRLPEQPYEPL